MKNQQDKSFKVTTTFLTTRTFTQTIKAPNLAKANEIAARKIAELYENKNVSG